jgi:hypothetical protein
MLLRYAASLHIKKRKRKKEKTKICSIFDIHLSEDGEVNLLHSMAIDWTVNKNKNYNCNTLPFTKRRR